MAHRQKEPLQLKEDTLEVGLDRYRKSSKSLPAWILDRGPAAVIGGLLLIVLGPLCILKGYFGPGSEPPPGPNARLTLVSEPMKVWAEGSDKQIKSVSVQVANSGPVQAKNVSVIVAIRDKEFQLRGPTTIPSGKTESFEGEAQINMRSGDAVAVGATCSNCS